MCRTPELVAVSELAYRCVNCNRWAYKCPECDSLRCASDIHFSIMGSIPLACKVCQPAGISTQMLAVNGAYQMLWEPKRLADS